VNGYISAFYDAGNLVTQLGKTGVSCNWLRKAHSWDQNNHGG